VRPLPIPIRSYKNLLTGRSDTMTATATGDVQAVLEERARAKRRFGLPADARVVSCDEPGRDGFWLHRFLVAHGIENHVVDSSSLEGNRRQRRAKTDRLDVHKEGEVRTAVAGSPQGGVSSPLAVQRVCARL
jgi:transposase